jgi:UDP-glucose 4-epimerase
VSAFLITGGAGFIGSHLADRALVLGHPVVVLDDLSQGSHDNLAQLVGQPRFTFVQASACDRRLLAAHVERAAVVFHFAASTMSTVEGTDWRTVLQQNHDATAAVLEVAAHLDKRVVLASSGEVYQNSQPSALAETDRLDLQTGNQQAVCRLSKIVDERLAAEAKTDTVVARLFPTIGPRLGFGLGGGVGRFVLESMLKVLRGQAIIVDGDLPEYVSLVDVVDVVHWLLLLACEPRASGQVFNLGSPVSVPVARLAEKIAQATDSQVDIRELPTLDADRQHRPSSRIPDVSRVMTLTKYSPRTKLDDSLRKIYAWLKTDDVYSFIAEIVPKE